MASTTIGTNFVKQFGSTLDLLTQIKGGKFDGKCLEDTITGEEKYYDQLAAVTANEIIDRYGDSPENDITHNRRRVVATPYDVGLMLDTMDKVQMLVNPESEYVQQMIYALNRKKDIEFIKGALGTAYSGKAGGTSNALAAANCIAGVDGGQTAMTIEKLIAARTYFEKNNVDLSDPMNKPYFVCTPYTVEDLLNETEVTSADYNTVKTLVNGDINTFCGFEFIQSNLVPYTTDGANQTAYLTWGTADAPTDTGTTDMRANFAYVKSGIRRVTNPSIQVDIEKRGDKRFNWYAYACMRTGAVRMEEDKVCIVGVNDSP